MLPEDDTDDEVEDTDGEETDDNDEDGKCKASVGVEQLRGCSAESLRGLR